MCRTAVFLAFAVASLHGVVATDTKEADGAQPEPLLTIPVSLSDDASRVYWHLLPGEDVYESAARFVEANDAKDKIDSERMGQIAVTRMGEITSAIEFSLMEASPDAATEGTEGAEGSAEVPTGDALVRLPVSIDVLFPVFRNERLSAALQRFATYHGVAPSRVESLESELRARLQTMHDGHKSLIDIASASHPNAAPAQEAETPAAAEAAPEAAPVTETAPPAPEAPIMVSMNITFKNGTQQEFKATVDETLRDSALAFAREHGPAEDVEAIADFLVEHAHKTVEESRAKEAAAAAEAESGAAPAEAATLPVAEAPAEEKVAETASEGDAASEAAAAATPAAPIMVSMNINFKDGAQHEFKATVDETLRDSALAFAREHGPAEDVEAIADFLVEHAHKTVEESRAKEAAAAAEAESAAPAETAAPAEAAAAPAEAAAEKAPRRGPPPIPMEAPENGQVGLSDMIKALEKAGYDVPPHPIYNPEKKAEPEAPAAPVVSLGVRLQDGTVEEFKAAVDDSLRENALAFARKIGHPDAEAMADQLVEQAHKTVEESRAKEAAEANPASDSVASA